MREQLEFAEFLRKYFPSVVTQPFTETQLQAIAHIQEAVLGKRRTGKFYSWEAAEADPRLKRGQGQTTYLITAALWAAGYAHHHHILLVTHTPRAAELIRGILLDHIDHNESFRAAFPDLVNLHRRWPAIVTSNGGTIGCIPRDGLRALVLVGARVPTLFLWDHPALE